MQDLITNNYILIGKIFLLLILINFISWAISKWQSSDSHLKWEYFVGSTGAGCIYLLSRWIIIAMSIIIALSVFLEWYFS